MTKKSKIIICIGIMLTSILGLVLGCLLYKDYKMQNEMIIICVYGILLTVFYLWILLQKSDSSHLKASGFPFMIIFYHVFNLAILILGMNLPAVYRPICAVPMLLTILFGVKTGLASMVLYSVLTVLFGLDPVEAILLYLIFGVAGSFLAVTFKSTVKLIIGSISLVAVYAVFYFGLNYYTYGEYLASDVLVGLLGGAIQMVVFLCFFPFVARTLQFNLDKKLNVICKESFGLLKALKERDNAVYDHSRVVAKLAEHAATAVDVNVKLVKAGALYHEIGQGLGGNYIKKGVGICTDNNIPEEVVEIIKEHNINVSKPTTKESAIVMLADTIISTIDGLRKKGSPIPDKDKLVDKIIALRISKGCLDACDMTAGDINKIKDAFCGAWRKKDGEGDVEDLLLEELLEVTEDPFEDN